MLISQNQPKEFLSQAAKLNQTSAPIYKIDLEMALDLPQARREYDSSMLL